MAEVKQISPAQRAQNFAAATRQNFHMLPAQTANQLGASMQFTFPKSRLLSKTFVKVEASIKGSPELMKNNYNTNKRYDVFNIIRRISLSLNNGFDPFVVSGRDLAIMNTVRMNPAVLYNVCDTSIEDDMIYNNCGLVAYKQDEDDLIITFLLELENTLNQRDTAGLILLQNESTQVTLSLDLETSIAKVNADATSLNYVKVTPMLQTFTIPNYAEAFPDLSILKLVKSRTESFQNGGEHILKLDVGTIYRKLVLYITDENGQPLTADEITSNIELIYNTADTPVSIDASMLRLKNATDFGTLLPEGMFVFDFSGYQGMSGLSGSRDFVDTERLSEFWIRFSTNAKCSVTVVQENISRLR